MKRVFLVTGIPGVGKTTVLSILVELLLGKGISVGGMLSEEVRENGLRVGFKIIDVANGKSAWLAHVKRADGPRLGKYHVNLEGLDSVAFDAIKDAVQTKSVVVIDEIGPMELFSEKFKQAVDLALESKKPVLAILHKKGNRYTKEIAVREDSEVCEVTLENRASIGCILAEKLFSLLSNDPV